MNLKPMCYLKVHKNSMHAYVYEPSCPTAAL